jgi:hypothetical protein
MGEEGKGMTKYRIVRDSFLGYEVQSWRWWFPFWVQGATNTHGSLSSAQAHIKTLKRSGEVVYCDEKK